MSSRPDAILFDVDDTLYDERTYVMSGLRSAAAQAAAWTGAPEQELYWRMVRALNREGRGRIFDRALEPYGAAQAERVQALVDHYRTHRPRIALFPHARAVLHALRAQGVRTGVVTDGASVMQRAKVRALGLEELVDAVVCTDELGAGCCKPQAVCYTTALEALGIAPGRAAYIGDDESRDFHGANALGMLTVRVAPPAWGLGARRRGRDASYRAARIAGTLREAVELAREAATDG